MSNMFRILYKQVSGGRKKTISYQCLVTEESEEAREPIDTKVNKASQTDVLAYWTLAVHSKFRQRRNAVHCGVLELDKAELERMMLVKCLHL